MVLNKLLIKQPSRFQKQNVVECNNNTTQQQTKTQTIPELILIEKPVNFIIHITGS